MRILVTGSAGFIGFHVTKRLLDEGDEVFSVDNLNNYYDPTLKQDRLAQLLQRPGFHFQKLDLADRQPTTKARAAISRCAGRSSAFSPINKIRL